MDKRDVFIMLSLNVVIVHIFVYNQTSSLIFNFVPMIIVTTRIMIIFPFCLMRSFDTFNKTI